MGIPTPAAQEVCVYGFVAFQSRVGIDGDSYCSSAAFLIPKWHFGNCYCGVLSSLPPFFRKTLDDSRYRATRLAQKPGGCAITAVKLLGVSASQEMGAFGVAGMPEARRRVRDSPSRIPANFVRWRVAGFGLANLPPAFLADSALAAGSAALLFSC